MELWYNFTPKRQNNFPSNWNFFLARRLNHHPLHLPGGQVKWQGCQNEEFSNPSVGSCLSTNCWLVDQACPVRTIWNCDHQRRGRPKYIFNVSILIDLFLKGCPNIRTSRIFLCVSFWHHSPPPFSWQPYFLKVCVGFCRLRPQVRLGSVYTKQKSNHRSCGKSQIECISLQWTLLNVDAAGNFSLPQACNFTASDVTRKIYTSSLSVKQMLKGGYKVRRKYKCWFQVERIISILLTLQLNCFSVSERNYSCNHETSRIAGGRSTRVRFAIVLQWQTKRRGAPNVFYDFD